MNLISPHWGNASILKQKICYHDNTIHPFLELLHARGLHRHRLCPCWLPQPQQYINWCLINASFPGGKKQPSTLTPSTSFYKHPVKCSSWDLGSAARLVESTVHRGLALRLTTHTFDWLDWLPFRSVTASTLEKGFGRSWHRSVGCCWSPVSLFMVHVLLEVAFHKATSRLGFPCASLFPMKFSNPGAPEETLLWCIMAEWVSFLPMFPYVCAVH